MITEVPLQDSGDGRHCKGNERPLVGVEALSGFDQPGAGDLQQILLVLAAVQESAGERVGEPKVGAHHLVKNLLTLLRSYLARFSQQLEGTVSQLVTLDLLPGLCIPARTAGEQASFGKGREIGFGRFQHERDTLHSLWVWRLARPRRNPDNHIAELWTSSARARIRRSGAKRPTPARCRDELGDTAEHGD